MGRGLLFCSMGAPGEYLPWSILRIVKNSPQSPPGTAFTIRRVALRAGMSRFPRSSLWPSIRPARDGWRLPFWDKMLGQAIPDQLRFAEPKGMLAFGA